MAAEGMRLTALYSMPTCMPSRACLLTGQHCMHTMQGNNNNAGAPLRPTDVTIGRVMKEAGYATGHVGKWAMKRCAEAGYPVRAVIMPIIPLPGWEDAYARFLRTLLAEVPLDRITLGGICSYRAARFLMEHRLGRSNAISDAFDPRGPSPDGRLRYPAILRTDLYRLMIGTIRGCAPDLDIGLCLEVETVFRALGLTDAIGRCNCVL